MLLLTTSFAAIQTFLCALLPSAPAQFNISLETKLPATEISVHPPILPFSHPPLTRKGIKQTPIPPNSYRIKTVVIDAGHGGHDPGCLGASTQEKNIALAIAKNVAIFMATQFPDIKVIMTRDADFFVPLHERAAIANRNNADLFISIHCNFMPGSSATKGSETYVMGLHTANQNLEVAKRENAAILLEEDYRANYDFDPNSSEAHILLSMFQNAHLDQSITLAEKVESKFKTSNRKSRGVRQAGFYVLKATTMPSILIETGFLSNRDEENYLNTIEGQETIANSILTAFVEYKNSIELGITPPPVETQMPIADNTVINVPPPTKKPTNPIAETPKVKVTEKPVNTSPSNTYNEPKVVPIGNVSTSTNVAGVQFCIQLSASSKPVDLSQSKWSSLPYAIEAVQEGNMYKYQARGFTDFETALRAKTNLKEQGFPDAFLVAYKSGVRISLEDAKRELGIQY